MEMMQEIPNTIQTVVQQYEIKKVDFPEIIGYAQNGNIDGIKRIIAKNGNVNYQNQYGDTALILASWDGSSRYAEIVKLLLEDRADVNVQNTKGDTALIWASFNGHEKIVKLLLEAGADVNLQNNNGDTALVLASRYKHNTEIVKLLFEAGSEIPDNYAEKFPQMVSVLEEFLQEQEIA